MLAVQSAPLTAPPASRALSTSRRRLHCGRVCAPAQAALAFKNLEVSVDTHKAALETGVGVVDITGLVRDAAAASGIRNGLVTVISKHTTTAVCVNENESRLFTDIQAFLLQLAPPLPKARYRHNDIELREPPPNWKGDVAEWRAQEPINAHAHLASMLVGSSESLPLVDGVLQIGTWQSLLLLELDGPRQRRVGVHIMGE